MPADPLDPLRNRLPEGAWPPVLEWIRQHQVSVRLARPRSSKLGDYRVDGMNRQARITVNRDLNPYAFLVTLVHEFAHHAAFLEAPRSESHGSEWRSAYQRLMRPYLTPSVLPPDVLLALTVHLRRPPASSCSDPQLMRALHRHDPAPGLLLERLPERAVFAFRGALYVKGPRLRKRFKCSCLNDRREFLMQPLIQVTLDQARSLPLPPKEPIPCGPNES